jgi:superfamily I DNA/RNA helicase
MILRAANAVIRQNTRRREKSLWSAKGEGSKITLYAFDTDETEGRTVAENIEYDRLTQQINWGKQAILFRTNIQSRPIEAALRKARIRYRLIGGQSFFDRSEIKDILAYLKSFVNPNDDVNLLRIANKPARGLSDVTMERLLAFSADRKASVYTIMRHTDVLASFQARTRDSITAFAHWIDTTRAPLLQNSPICLSNWADHWLEETGYLADLRRAEKNQDVADNRVRNIQELIDDLDGELTAAARRKKREETAPKKATKPVDLENDPEGLLSDMTPAPRSSGPLLPNAVPEFLGKPMDRLDEFLAGITLDQEREEEKDTTGDQVTLITMHAAKGLEFPHVHIVGVEDGLLPHSRSKDEGTLDEERRLFYVGITRAQETLRISHCSGRRRYDQVMPCHPSPFLRELPPECVEDADEAAARPVDKDDGGDWFKAMREALE